MLAFVFDLNLFVPVDPVGQSCERFSTRHIVNKHGEAQLAEGGRIVILNDMHCGDVLDHYLSVSLSECVKLRHLWGNACCLLMLFFKLILSQSLDNGGFADSRLPVNVASKYIAVRELVFVLFLYNLWLMLLKHRFFGRLWLPCAVLPQRLQHL